MKNCSSQNDDQSSVWFVEQGVSFDDSDSVHLWRVCLDCDEFSVNQWQLLLSEEERDRSLKYRFLVDRNCFIVRRGMLRKILAGYLSCEPQAVKFRTGEFGKLCLAESPFSLEFSVTHSQTMALFAVTPAGAVGVDLECVQPISDLEIMLDSCLSQSERSTLETFPSALRLDHFYRLWTCKEAYLKAIGVGLDRPLASVEVVLHAVSADSAVTLRVGGKECFDFAVRTFVPFAGYVAAIVTPNACKLHAIPEI
jgi:4'-phosphopantetheinyl transferase